ncbi:hypothetical protein C2E20_2385 [Micractinium conductrix]|uniref:Uncharacterized protein n=1 Tax=Micractinium conductrix TaxID=554055 RepID=A0A2P6VKN1_9CHLO|nr:hypothetical protein C2E20_2385 [Micractinium conductrix]|eukprot:PSC74653.1 hypothetical protein C2E20_2385 [Micractinium conductrix]
MGYGQAPWEFSGRALYQLSLVRVEEARKYVPAELPLVNFLGWTLGGFYLARYDASPVGAFDECVALAGLAWNWPTSCAWAARVFVNNKEARDHGISAVGLPSRLAAFSALPELAAARGGGGGGGGKRRGASWWDVPHPRSTRGGGAQGSAAGGAGAPTAALELCNSEPGGRGRGLEGPVCVIDMPRVLAAWAPKIQMSLPSFSGATPDHPPLLKYRLKLTAFVRPLAPARVSFPAERAEGERRSDEVLDAVLGGCPLLCLAFDGMRMEVQPPEVWQPRGATGGTPAAA